MHNKNPTLKAVLKRKKHPSVLVIISVHRHEVTLSFAPIEIKVIYVHGHVATLFFTPIKNVIQKDIHILNC